MLKVGNVRVPLKTKAENYPKILSNHLNIREKQLQDVQLLRRSIDARKADVHYICSFAFSHPDEKRLLAKNPALTVYEPYQDVILPAVKRKTIVVGSGPAGLFCAWALARTGSPVVLIERGKTVQERCRDVALFKTTGKLNENSNIQFGEGGAGTFSDGKLTTGIKDPRVMLVLQTLVAYGAPKDILVDALPHIGTDYLQRVVQNMREDLIRMGADVRFETQLTDLLIEKQRVVGIEVNHQEKIMADEVVLAIGHSARDTFEMLYARGIEMQAKPFAVGLRIEHLQSDVNQAQYRQAASSLKAAPYKAAYHSRSGRGVYTFCMCPGGEVVAAASEAGRLVTNGMSEYARAQTNANSAVLVSVDTRDYGSQHPLAGMYYQRDLEQRAFALGGKDYRAPCSLVRDYLAGTLSTAFGKVQPSYQPGVTFARLDDLFSAEINEALKEGLQAFGRKLPFFRDGEAVLTGVESRSSSPVRFFRDASGMASLQHLYPCGEGAGQAGGIVSAAVDGLKIAESILTQKA